ncbi:hypothetical protein [Cryptosporangium phraense]|uniref:Uncharacterized protein n=1 Tax=Cryptosporangium phraense TaxID=2593070 RepID=A0A545AXM8_9ACTN|nr:hypothetical protein [Cryptosporangium phraense]TQS46093.1 hypothetical protein FL583_06320 [Cryptosporangium phraense]
MELGARPAAGPTETFASDRESFDVDPAARTCSAAGSGRVPMCRTTLESTLMTHSTFAHRVVFDDHVIEDPRLDGFHEIASVTCR